MKPGPQPWNQISGTASEQIKRAFVPEPETLCILLALLAVLLGLGEAEGKDGSL